MVNFKSVFIERRWQAVFLMGIRGVSLVSKFVLTLFIARFMGFEVLGVYGLIVSATFLFPAFTGLGIMHVKSRNAVTQSSREIVRMLYYYGRFISLIYAVLIVVAFITGYLRGEVWFAFIISLVILFEHINNDFYSLLLNLSKPFAANILHFIRTSVWIIVFMALAFIEPSLQNIEILLIAWMFGGILAFSGFFLVTKIFPWSEKPQFTPLFHWIKQEFKKSRAIYLNVAMDTSGQYLNHFLVTIFLGLELTGVYVYFMQVISALSNLLRTGIIQTARPKLVRACKLLDLSFLQIYKQCMRNTRFMSIIMAIISMPAMYFMTYYIVDKPLALEWFPIFFVSLIFFVIFMITEVRQLVLYSHHRDDLTLKLSFLNIVGLVVLNIVLIPLFSLWGAAIALLIMVVLRLVIQHRMVLGLMKEV